jgi:(2Fe-2S) ferredoxin
MAKFSHHIFVCCNERPAGHPRGCCNPDGTAALRAAFKAELIKRRLHGQVRANSSGCLDQCELGPTVVIYPQEIWYGGVQLEDVPRIVEQTIVGGQIIESLRIQDEMLNTKGKPPRDKPPRTETTGPHTEPQS